MFSTDQSWLLFQAPQGKGVAAGVTGTLLFSPFEKRHFHKARGHNTYNYIFLQTQFCLLTGKHLSANKAPVALSPPALLAGVKALEEPPDPAKHSSQPQRRPCWGTAGLPQRGRSLRPWGWGGPAPPSLWPQLRTGNREQVQQSIDHHVHHTHLHLSLVHAWKEGESFPLTFYRGLGLSLPQPQLRAMICPAALPPAPRLLLSLTHLPFRGQISSTTPCQ